MSKSSIAIYEGVKGGYSPSLTPPTISNQEEPPLSPPPSQRPISRLPQPEENPWRNISYILTTLQLMMTTLDLFMESGNVPWIHYTITTLQFIPALYLALYQAIRIRGLWKYRKDSSTTLQIDLNIRKPFFFLLLALSFQLFVLIVSGLWYDIGNDVNTTHFEWVVWVIVLLFSLVNPMTYSSVAKVADEASHAGVDTKKKARMGPGAAAWSIFTKHFMREKPLFALGALAACGKAILSTYQGAIINELTKLVTKVRLDLETGELKISATYEQVEYKSVLLVVVWVGANLCELLFDVVSAFMFSRLEVWLKGAVFEKAITYGRNRQDADGDISDPATEFGARYASDVQGVIGLYGTLLRGVIVNVILIITSFIFLVLYNWEVAVVTLCFLAMAVTSGPTDLARNAARAAQKESTEGLGKLTEGIRSSSDLDANPELLCKQHTEEVMVPLKKSLFAQIFYTDAVDSYIHLFSSFLTVVVVITMATSVYEGEMDSSDFLGVFFVFKQLQKPAMKSSSILKKLIRSSANLERLDKTIFVTSESRD